MARFRGAGPDAALGGEEGGEQSGGLGCGMGVPGGQGDPRQGDRQVRSGERVWAPCVVGSTVGAACVEVTVLSGGDGGGGPVK